MPVAASVHLVDDLFPPGRRYSLRTRSLAGLTKDVITTLVEAGDHNPSPLCSLNVHHFHGAAARIGPSDTAFALRGNHLVVEIVAAWERGAGSSEIEWADQTARSLDPNALAGDMRICWARRTRPAPRLPTAAMLIGSWTRSRPTTPTASATRSVCPAADPQAGLLRQRTKRPVRRFVAGTVGAPPVDRADPLARGNPDLTRARRESTSPRRRRVHLGG